MACDLLDIRCILINEIIGSVFLAVIVFAILYFIIASKIKLGFDATIAMAIPVIAGFGIVITGFSAIYAFGTFFVAILLALVFLRMIGNK